MTTTFYRNLLFILPLLAFQGCVKYYSSDKAPKVSGHVYAYNDNTPEENIKIGSILSDKKGYFELPSSDSDGGDGFSVSKDFDININDNIAKCTCYTIWPHDTVACDKIQFYIEDDDSAIYYFNASYAVPSLYCDALNSKIKILSLEDKNAQFMIVVPKEGLYDKMRVKIYRYFHKTQFSHTVNYEIEDIYFYAITEILKRLSKDIVMSNYNGIEIAQISKKKVHDFFIDNEEEFFGIIKKRLYSDEYPEDYKFNLDKISGAFYKTLNSMLPKEEK